MKREIMNNNNEKTLKKQKKEKKPMTAKQMKVRKALSIVGTVLAVFIVISTLGVSISSITRLDKNGKGVANIFGWAIMPVRSDSMEPAFNQYDLIFTKLYDGDGSDLKVGTVITFWQQIGDNKVLNTHRIDSIDTVLTNPEEVKDGKAPVYITGYFTRGDNTAGRDDKYRVIDDVVAVWEGGRVGKVGKLILTLQDDKIAYLCAIVLPLILLLVVYLAFFVNSVIKLRTEKMKAKLQQEVANGASLSLDQMTDEQKMELLLKLQAEKTKQEESVLHDEVENNDIAIQDENNSFEDNNDNN